MRGASLCVCALRTCVFLCLRTPGSGKPLQSSKDGTRQHSAVARRARESYGWLASRSHRGNKREGMQSFSRKRGNAGRVDAEREGGRGGRGSERFMFVDVSTLFTAWVGFCISWDMFISTMRSQEVSVPPSISRIFTQRLATLT